MTDTPLLEAILNSLKNPLLFVNTDHVIQYMNAAAVVHYKEGVNLIGRSIFECHNKESNRMIVEVFDAFGAGEDERLITDNEKYRIYMRAVRDAGGHLLGYYERYEPPAVRTTIEKNAPSK